MSERTNLVDPATMSPRRCPLFIKLLSVSFLVTSIFGWLRFFASIQKNPILDAYGFTPGIHNYLIISGLVIGLVCLPTLVVLHRRCITAQNVCWTAVGIVLLLRWYERIALWDPVKNARTLPFFLLISLLWLGLTALSLRLPICRKYLSNPCFSKKGSNENDNAS